MRMPRLEDNNNKLQVIVKKILEDITRLQINSRLITLLLKPDLHTAKDAFSSESNQIWLFQWNRIWISRVIARR